MTTKRPLGSESCVIFKLPQDSSLKRLRATLRANSPITEESVRDLKYSYLDSFDWRLYDAGMMLASAWQEDVLHLRLCSLAEAWCYTTPAAQAFCPKLANDIADPRLRALVAPAVNGRALLPLVSVNCRERPFRILNKDGKTVVKLQFCEERLGSREHRGTADLGSWLRLSAVRGYENAFEKWRALVCSDLGATPQLPFTRYLAAAGRQPGDYSSKLDIRLLQTQRADVAARVILRHLVKTMIANEDGICRDLDPEFLHDFRVAVRRTRSLLGQVKSVFPEQRVRRFRAEFSWLGQVTGTARDMDVYLSKFTGLKTSLPATFQEDLMPLLGHLRTQKDLAHVALVRALQSSRYQKLKHDWLALLDAEVPQRSNLANATRPIAAVADECIRRVHRRALKEGKQIREDSPPPMLHQLRRTCKKLRYLLEFFHSLYPRDAMENLLAPLKKLQDNLGDYQDLQVQQEVLLDFRQTVESSHELTQGNQHAIDLLVQTLVKRQTSRRAEFRECFRGLQRERGRFKTLFSPKVAAIQAQALSAGNDELPASKGLARGLSEEPATALARAL
ncbi:MAG: CHAD domain-containing protein [Gammaproteobacteria bacterium]